MLGRHTVLHSPFRRVLLQPCRRRVGKNNWLCQQYLLSKPSQQSHRRIYDGLRREFVVYPLPKCRRVSNFEQHTTPRFTTGHRHDQRHSLLEQPLPHPSNTPRTTQTTLLPIDNYLLDPALFVYSFYISFFNQYLRISSVETTQSSRKHPLHGRQNNPRYSG
jgi:hypothetical protein